MREVDTRGHIPISGPLAKLGWDVVTLHHGQDVRFSTLQGRIAGIQIKKVSQFMREINPKPGKRLSVVELQLLELRQSVDFPLFVIVGSLFPTHDGYAKDERGTVYPRKFTAVQEILSKIEDKGIRVVAPFPTSEYQTVQTIIALERNYNKRTHRFLERSLSGDKVIEILTRFPLIDEARALALKEYFESLDAIFSATEKEFCQVSKIGKGVAKAFKDYQSLNWQRTEGGVETRKIDTESLRQIPMPIKD